MRGKWFAMTGVAVGAMIGVTASAAPDTAEKARIFGARDAIQQASLSPDGMKVAFVQPLPSGQGSAVYVTDLSVPGQLVPNRILVAGGDPERIGSCRWASNIRLICNIYGITRYRNVEIIYSSRMVAMNADGANLKVLENRSIRGMARREATYGGDIIDWAPGIDGHVLMMRDYVPEEDVGTLVAQKKDGIGVDDLDVTTLRSRTVEQPRDDANEYITDGKGTVRIMGVRGTAAYGYNSGQQRYFYRALGKREWLLLSTVDYEARTGFDPHGVDPTLNLVYGLNRIDGRLAAVSRSLEGDAATEKLVLAHPQVDVDNFLRIGRNRRIIGVSYATDRREFRYFDPALDKLATSLSRSLPNAPKIRFIDSSQDESRLLIWAGGDTDPGHYYLLDRTTKKMEELAADRPEIGFPLSQVKAVTFPAADGTLIPAYLTFPPGGVTRGLPAIVMPHGGPEARDEWGFDWLAQFFANQGYAVLQPNFRGSDGYGNEWFQKNGFQNWRIAIGDVNDAGKWLVKEGMAQPGKLAIFGWSYGGYAALQSGVIEPDLFKAVIAVAPVTDLDRLRQDRINFSDYQVLNRYIGTGPHVAAGSPARHADQIKAPVLLFHGTLDRNVEVGHSRAMEDSLKAKGKASQLVIYEGLDHYLEDSTARADMLAKSAAFLEKALIP